MKFNTRLLIGYVAVVCFAGPAQSEPNMTQAVYRTADGTIMISAVTMGSEARY